MKKLKLEDLVEGLETIYIAYNGLPYPVYMFHEIIVSEGIKTLETYTLDLNNKIQNLNDAMKTKIWPLNEVKEFIENKYFPDIIYEYSLELWNKFILDNF